jgi:hypothetical protein
MVKKAEEGTDVNKLIAGKFKTQEDFDKSILEAVKKKHGEDLEGFYNSLSGDLSQDSSEDADSTDAEDTTDGSDTTENDDSDASDEANEDNSEDKTDDDSDDSDIIDLDPHMEKFVEEFQADGKLSSESYETLKEAGYEKPMVDTFLKGVQATMGELKARVGGEENYAEMQTWAAKNLDDASIDLFNTDMNSGDQAKMERAVDLLKAKYVEANGGFAPKKRVNPTGGEINTSVSGYQSIDEMKADMKDPRYQTDRAFRQKVREKIRNGNI